jgi:hypothetical protein
VEEKDYEPGKYYSLSDDAIGAKPYVLDNGPYDSLKTYYLLAENMEANRKEGPASSYVDLTEAEAADESWKTSTIFQFYKEKKLCIIGSNTMSAPIRVV